MADGSQYIAGDLTVAGAATVNGAQTIAGTLAVTAAVTAPSVTLSSFAKLTPLADAPTPASEGQFYADTDHKLYFYNGTDWKEVAFV